jgi:peptidoglycan hydrolase-like protein with peptidoglycan-binding domain/DNA invertase Pin-like site-specific DNA recombinase
MTIKLAATRGWTSIVTALVVLVAAAVASTAVVPATALADATQTPVLAVGAGMGAKPDPAVRKLQRTLRSRGYDLGRPGVDGRFGPLTAAAVRRLQANYGLAADGIVGPKTRRLVVLIKRRPQRTSATKRPTPTTKPAPSPVTKRPSPVTNRPVPVTQRPAPVVTVHAQDGDRTLLGALLLAALAALIASLWLATRGRMRGRRSGGESAPAITPIGREVYVEGRSEDPDVGEFRGHALAAALSDAPDDEPAPERTSYLVDDVGKPAPLWVRGTDIQRATSGLGSEAPVIGYVMVSAEGPPQEADGPARLIEAACQRGGWALEEVVTDRENGHGLDKPGLTYALERIANGEARGLVVSDMRRLCHSIADMGALMGWFIDANATLVALDLSVDTSTAAGREIAATMIRLADWDQSRAARRSRQAVTAVRSGGRPAVADREQLAERITAMRASGMTLQAIADQLNNENVPTLRGGKMWRPSSVQTALGYRRPTPRTPREQLPPLEHRG